jgi:pimeloyl-ACP methyl ester carboxylesterase
VFDAKPSTATNPQANATQARTMEHYRRLGFADEVRGAIAEADGPVVLCGHPYGGVVIGEAEADERVTHLLYVTPVMPAAGQSQAEIVGPAPAPWMAPGDDGTVGVHADLVTRHEHWLGK